MAALRQDETGLPSLHPPLLLSTPQFGLGFWEYMKDGFNVFDIIIVSLAYLEIILSSVQGLNALRALRALRVLRLLKMFK